MSNKFDGDKREGHKTELSEDDLGNSGEESWINHNYTDDYWEDQYEDWYDDNEFENKKIKIRKSNKRLYKRQENW